MLDMATTSIFLLIVIVPCLAVGLRVAVGITRGLLGPANPAAPVINIESSAQTTTERDESNPYSAPRDTSVSRLALDPELSFGKAYGIAAAQSILTVLAFISATTRQATVVLILGSTLGLGFPIVVGLLQLTSRLSFGRAIIVAVIQYALIGLVVAVAAAAVRFAIN